eukprot:TRINITY_DN3070_c0_g1_i4.p1 TRINITY_DN3070_c0_g1~~TRINITY_DN3070_c0_g1_i4.p1  ORF type:complete len:442 (-),score=66.03 TRINITY_DN3070_c0_g1_i4:28-1353(-)
MLFEMSSNFTRLPGEENEDHKIELNKLYWLIFLLNVGVQWPYQSVIQAQAYYVARFPDSNLEFLVLMATTWPLLIGHMFQVSTGIADRFGFTKRFMAAIICFEVMAVLVIVQDQLNVSQNVHIILILAAAVLTSIGQSLSEPPLYAIAGVFPTGDMTQAMNAGNGLTGVIVVVANIISRLVVGGGSSADDLRKATYVFFGILMVYLLFCVYAFIKLRWHPLTRYYINQARSLEPTQRPPRKVVNASKSGLAREPHDDDSTASMHERCSRLSSTFISIWLPACCEFLIFFISLLLWPTLPCSAPLSSFFSHIDSWFCSPIIIACFNGFDFVGRVMAGSARWTSLSLRQLCVWSVARVFLVPVVFFCVHPVWISQTWVLLLVVMLIGWSNGFLATVLMMQGPMLVDFSHREYAAYVMVAALYAGLSLGSTSAWLTARSMGLAS